MYARAGARPLRGAFARLAGSRRTRARPCEARAGDPFAGDRCLVSDGWLTIAVRDDGVGGADPLGPGLSGLCDRLRALDGELKVVSPAGGPTVIVAEIPCAS